MRGGLAVVQGHRLWSELRKLQKRLAKESMDRVCQKLHQREYTLKMEIRTQYI